MNTFRPMFLRQIMTKKPSHLCVGFVSKEEMAYLVFLLHRGEISHLLFLDCDPVECWIEIVWSDSPKQTVKPQGHIYLITEDGFPDGLFDVNWREIFTLFNDFLIIRKTTCATACSV